MTTTTFADFGLQPALARALDQQGFSVATPIQARAIPILLEGRDLLGLAQTGTGKTAAFALPLLEQLSLENVRPTARKPRALILAPTRELALQIATALKNLGRHTRLKFLVVVGGVGFRKQTEPLDAGVDIVVATPGRLEDLMQNRKIELGQTRHLILDEADRMLDIGFAPAIRRIVAAMPAVRQSALFSATMPKTVERLAAEILREPERVEVAPAATTAEKVEQRVYHTDQRGKRALLANLLEDPDMNRVIVFVRTKHAANRLAEQLDRDIGGAEAIHGNKSHNARQQALERFKRGKARLLVATDIAARGIDVSDVSHVVNFDLPNDAESYVHRIGRTARAGRGGVAISFCAPDERGALREIEKLTRQRMTVVGDAPAPEVEVDRAPRRQGRPRRPGAGRGGAPRPSSKALAMREGRRPNRG